LAAIPNRGVIASDAGEHGSPAVEIPWGVLAIWRAEVDDLLLARAAADRL